MNTIRNEKGKKSRFFRGLLIILTSLVVILGVYAVIHVIKLAQAPSIEIILPTEGDLLYQFGPSTVQAVAIERGRPVSRLDLYIDGVLFGSAMGDTDSLPGTWQWTPLDDGIHSIAFVAVNDIGMMNTSAIDVDVIAVSDLDGDDVPDDVDNCPAVFGFEVASGCPVDGDIDGDGLSGGDDLCPELFGDEYDHGCPPGGLPDADADGVLDDTDLCSDAVGMSDFSGCPVEAWFLDTDGDGTPDFLDRCLSLAGDRYAYGCPLAEAGDRDGDGVEDAMDACPDEPGALSSSGCVPYSDRDGDGVADESDVCPDEAGLSSEEGCRGEDWMADSDSDGVIDIYDLSMHLPGPIDFLGFPSVDDRDGDGVADITDNCPDLFGSAENEGCPFIPYPSDTLVSQKQLFSFFPVDSSTDDSEGVIVSSIIESFPNDRDGDGVEDPVDECPDEYGEPSAFGCRPENDRDMDGISDSSDRCPDIPGLYWGEFTDSYMLGCPRETPVLVNVELEVTAIRIPEDMVGVYCYVTSVATESAVYPDRLPPEYRMYSVFPVEGYGYYLRLSEMWPRVTRSMYETTEVGLYMACWGQAEGISLPGRYLGEIYRVHGAEDWDSQSRYAAGVGDGITFEIHYRLCRNNCP
jgi:hypothetical protein